MVVLYDNSSLFYSLSDLSGTNDCSNKSNRMLGTVQNAKMVLLFSAPVCTWEKNSIDIYYHDIKSSALNIPALKISKETIM